MERRRYLQASVGVASAALAGCTALADETELKSPTEGRDDEAIRYVYERDGDAILRVHFIREPGPDGGRRLDVRVEQSGDTTLDAYRFRFRPAGDGDGASADVYLLPPPAGHAADVETYRDGDWTVVSVPEYDSGRRVTTGFELLVVGDGADGGSLEVDYEVPFTEDGFLGSTYVARERTTVPLDGAE